MNEGAVAALGLRKAMEELGSAMPFEVRVCRISRVGAPWPETRRFLARKLRWPPLKTSVARTHFFTIVSSDGVTGEPFRVPAMRVRRVPRYVSEFKDWLRGAAASRPVVQVAGAPPR